MRLVWVLVSVRVHRVLLVLDAELAAGWFTQSGLFAAARRCECELAKRQRAPGG